MEIHTSDSHLISDIHFNAKVISKFKLLKGHLSLVVWTDKHLSYHLSYDDNIFSVRALKFQFNLFNIHFFVHCSINSFSNE